MPRATHEDVPRRFEIHTSDHHTAVSIWEGLYGEVDPALPRGFEWRAHAVDFGPILFVQDHTSDAIYLDAQVDAPMLVIPVRGSGRAALGRDSATLGHGGGPAIFSAHGRSKVNYDSAMEVITVRFDRGYLCSQLESITGEVVREDFQFQLSLDSRAGSGSYVERLCRFMAAEINAGTDIDHPKVFAGLTESLSRALLMGQPHNLAHLLERPTPPSSRTVLRRVEEYVDAHAAGPISAIDLAAVAGTSARSVEAAFRAHRGTSLGTFFRDRRLVRAQRALLAEPHLAVLCVARAAGFARREVFESAYVRAFGERPEETRRRGLLAAGTAPGEAEPSQCAAPSAAVEPATVAARMALLSAREREVCEGVARGLLNKQIAEALGISERTVKEHRARVMAKLEARSAVELGILLQKARG
ncbi:LuxR C-terminal-related transcriptional regulator [Sorangium sp. So ce448]|uniref:LuxR C-terminal-related transcriptional regulator n=1 Tax=Sorangium sp. So ce448 TaxID=3133314 RepID=UPI003F5E8AEE